MAHGIWMVEDKRLVIGTGEMGVVRRCSAIALFLQMESASLPASRAMLPEIRKLISPDVRLLVSITDGLFVGSTLPPDLVSVSMLCR
jgi:hypothetical protein